MWVEKFRPKSFDEFVFQDDVTELHIRKYVKEGIIPHLLFSGPPGTGKTSCAFLLTSLLDIDSSDVLLINASKENSTDTVRDKISAFCSVAPLNSDFKVVILEEADFMTGGAQAILRRLMEEQYRTVRFIMTCNYVHKIKDAIDSRTQHYVFNTLQPDKIAERVVGILNSENVTWNAADVERVINRSPTDLRKIIGTLEQYTVEGQLLLPTHLTAGGDTDAKILSALAADDWNAMRGIVASDVADNQVIDLFRLLYNNLSTSPIFLADDMKQEQAIVTIAEYLYRSSTVADQYINFAALLIELKRIQHG